MDRVWMRERLESFKTLNERYDQANRQARYESSPETKALNSEINGEVPTIRKIVEALNPDLVEDITEPMHMYGTSKTRSAVEQALGILRDEDVLRAKLAPDAPSLVADQFHSTVWKAASAIWDTGQYRVAVQQAAVSLSAHIAAKAGSSLTERALVSQVFSKDEPRPGQVRLHMLGDKTTETWRSRQDGLHLIAQGAFAGIRNVATHTADEWTEQVALEHLAVLSVVARWADETVPVTASP
jgi:DNA-binding transcriptional ArsR family regulator